MSGIGRRLGRLFIVAVSAATVAAVVAACGSSSSSSSSSSGSSASSATSSGSSGSGSVSGKHVFVVSCAPTDPYCASYNSLLQKGLQAKGVQVNLVTNAKDSALEEQQLVQGISQSPDLIVNLPTDSSAVASGYSKARAAHIPVISTVNPVSPTAASVVTSQVYDNNDDMGRIAAENIQAGLGKLGLKSANVIAITGNAASLTTTQRLNAFKAQLAKTPQFKLVAVQDGGWDPVKTQQIASQLFAAYQGKGGIQGAYGMSGLQAVGIIRAAQAAGMPVGAAHKGLIVSGSNCGPVSVKAIMAGQMYGDATETPVGDVNAVVPYILNILQGQSIPKVVLVPETAITSANAKQWLGPCTY